MLIQTGILDGDPNEYPIRNIYAGCATPTINHKLGTLHKKISVYVMKMKMKEKTLVTHTN